MFLLILAFILLGDVAWWLWADYKVRRLPRARLWRTLVATWAGLMLGYLLFFLLFRDMARQAHAWVPVWILGIFYVWHLLILPATVLFILGDGVVALVRRVVAKTSYVPVSTPNNSDQLVKEHADSLAPSRRQLLGAALAAAPPVVALATTAISMRRVHEFRVRSLELPLAQLPHDLDGMTIAHVSDLHVGRFTRPHMLPRIADAVNNLKADLVLFTGDLIDLTLSDLPAGIDFIRRLDPRSGVFLCEGNHDLIEDRDGFEFGVRRAGLSLLLNESVVTSVRDTQLQLLGLTWMRGDAQIRAAISHLQRQLRPDLFQILLAHHPHAFDPASNVGIPLTLAGHTHGGQLMLNERLGAGPAMFRYWTGAYRQGDSALVVSNGVGNWFPVRINAPAEIIHLTLRRASST